MLEGRIVKRNILIAALILSFILIAGTAQADDAFILVSDLDDTVKITHVHNRDNMTCNAIASKLVFAGMPQLYLFLLGENYPAGRLMFLSGTPSFLSHKVRELLNDAHFPGYSLTLRGFMEFFNSPVSDFKKKKMEELYGASRGDNFILIGDDTEKDPEVYADFSANKNQNKVLAIYIHRITGRDLPQGSITFVTAYDIAMHEFKAGRLSEKQVAEVGDAVLKSDDVNFMPDFQCCSKDYEQIPGLPDNLAQLKKQIEDRMTTLCSKRTNSCQTQ
jgi:hypothetical protein